MRVTVRGEKRKVLKKEHLCARRAAPLVRTAHLVRVRVRGRGRVRVRVRVRVN